MKNQGTNEDDSQSDPRPEAGLFRSQTTQNSVPEVGHDMVTGATECHDMVTGATERHDMVTGATEEFRNRHDMVTGGSEEIRNGPDMVTGVQEEIRNGHDMVTKGSKEIRNGHDMVTRVQKESLCGPDMVTGIQEEILSCSRGIFLGKQKKARSTSQPQFAVKKPLRQLKQTRFVGPSTIGD